MQKQLDIQNLSKHLFWDVDASTLDIEKHQNLIVSRVLEYGMLDDFRQLQSYFGLKKMGKIASQLRELEPKSANFISQLSEIPLNKFRCYTTQQSQPKHWNF